MRLRLFVSFGVIILITVITSVIIIRQNMVDEVRTFMFRGGMIGLNDLVTNLEDCYQEEQSWDACAELLDRKGGMQGNMPGDMGGGRMGNNPPGKRESQHVQLLDQDGYVLADTQDSIPSEPRDISSLQAAIPLHDQGEVVGYLLPENQYAFTVQQETYLISRLSKAALTSAAIAGVTAFLLASYLAYQLLQPIRKLTKAAENIKQGNLEQRVDIQGNTELTTLGQVFNQMAYSLERSAERRKALTADIAHELRTPLSVQQAHLEALQDGIYDLNMENLRPIQEQNQTLVRLVDDLRTLSLADAGELTLERTETNITQLVANVVSQFEPQAKKKGVQISVAAPPTSPHIKIDPQRIEQIIINLLDNAIRHSPEGKSVQLEIKKEKDEIILAVRDHGEGIPEEEIPFIFERFYKSSPSRKREDGGTGLGLSISQKLAQAHGGNLVVHNHPQGGAEFSLSLPL
ncbi:MAG: ATP-binding protein [Anaerolineales bacterium]